MDPRYFSAANIKNRLESYFQMLEQKRLGGAAVKYTVGIDLGSTTTKAVVLGEDGAVLGRGITNSRSNYDVACQVALGEALINTRFSLIAASCGDRLEPAERDRRVSRSSSARSAREQYSIAAARARRASCDRFARGC